MKSIATTPKATKSASGRMTRMAAEATQANDMATLSRLSVGAIVVSERPGGPFTMRMRTIGQMDQEASHTAPYEGDLFFVDVAGPMGTGKGRPPLPRHDARPGARLIASVPTGHRPYLEGWGKVEPDLTILPYLKDAGYVGACLTTFAGSVEPLVACMGPRAIQEFVERCSTLGLISVLDGSIDEADIASLAPSRPDYIVFRRGAIALHHSPYELDAKRIESIMYGIARLQTTDGEGGRTLVDPARTPRVAVRIRRDADIAIVRAERVDRIDFCGEFVFDESTPLDGDEVRSIEISHADLGKSRRLLHDARADQIFVDLRNLDPESLDSFLVGHPDLTDAGHVAVIALSQGLSCIPALAAAGFMGAMLAAEDGTRLLVNRSTIALVSQFVELSRNAGLESHLRGGLEAPDLPRLETALPDVLHFDEGVRTDGALDPVKIASIRSLAIRRPGKPVKNFDASTKTDRIVVKDMIVDMQIGAYDFERGKTQKVSFSVEVDVARTSEMPSHLCDIYSYDLVMDGVRSLVDRGHTDLVETLAEELAAIVLDHPRAVRAHVSVEKLELGPGRCGIQIVRPD